MPGRGVAERLGSQWDFRPQGCPALVHQNGGVGTAGASGASETQRNRSQSCPARVARVERQPMNLVTVQFPSGTCRTIHRKANRCLLGLQRRWDPDRTRCRPCCPPPPPAWTRPSVQFPAGGPGGGKSPPWVFVSEGNLPKVMLGQRHPWGETLLPPAAILPARPAATPGPGPAGHSHALQSPRPTLFSL